MNWILFWLVLHITAAVIAFGPTFVFPLIGRQVQKNPTSIHFAMELNHVITTRLVVPLAVTMLISGVGLIFAANINLLKTTYLLVAILFYLVALGIAFGIEMPTASKLVDATASAPPADAPPGPPPPEILALINRARLAGMVLTLLFFAIIFLMIIKPGGIVNGHIFG